MDENIDNEFSFKPIEDTADKEADKAKLQAELQAYQKALQEEWETGVQYSEGKLTPPEIRDKTKELLTQGVPKAVAGMLYLCQHARSEQVMLSAQKFVIERAIGKEGTGLVGDPLEELMRTLRDSAQDRQEG